MGDLFKGETHPAVQVVDHIGDDLGIGLQRASVAVHLDMPTICVVAGDFTIVHHAVGEQAEGVAAAPPSRSVGGVAAVNSPAIAFVLVEHVELAYVLGESDSLEYAHVLARGEHIGPLDLPVDADDAPGGILILVQLAEGELGGKRGDKVPPDEGYVGDGGVFLGGNLGEVDKIEVFFKELLACPLGFR